MNNEPSAPSKSRLRAVIGFNLALDILILDQISKWYVLEHILRPHFMPGTVPHDLLSWYTQAPGRISYGNMEIMPFFNLVMVWNQGISFGLFQGGSLASVILLTAISLLITAGFSVWLTRAQGWTLAAGLGLVIGGALGNVIDRLRFGGVADFLDVHAMGYHWPAFNVADAGITGGIALILIDGLFLAPRRAADPSTAAPRQKSL